MDTVIPSTLIVGVLLAVVAAIIIAVPSTQATEIIKQIRNWVAKNPDFADKIPTGPVSSWLISLAVALATVLGFNQLAVQSFPVLAGADLTMVSVIMVPITWAASNFFHKYLPGPQTKVPLSSLVGAAEYISPRRAAEDN